LHDKFYYLILLFRYDWRGKRFKDSGYNFDISWFDPFFFRFPHHGNVTMCN
jgi:hypothetical protein